LHGRDGAIFAVLAGIREIFKAGHCRLSKFLTQASNQSALLRAWLVVNSRGYSHGGVIRWWWKMAGMGEVGVTIVSEEEIVALAGVL
jgi:hypothetical protein